MTDLNQLAIDIRQAHQAFLESGGWPKVHQELMDIAMRHLAKKDWRQALKVLQILASIADDTEEKPS